MTNVIETEGLTKKFGEVLAIDHLNLKVKEGSVFGFLGPNGAGKTTTQRLLVGLARPTEGTARILGYNILTSMGEISKRIGFLPDVPTFYNWMNATDYLNFAANIFGIPQRETKSKIGTLLELAGLSGVKTKVGGYSRGMKQRLGIAQALINDPKVILMDEPTSALDPIGRKEVLDMIAALGKEITVFFSTHILNDVERVCDTVAILNKGRLMTEESLESLKAKYLKPTFTLELSTNPGELAARLEGLPWVVVVERSGDNILKVTSKDLESGERELPLIIAELKLPLKSFQEAEPSLEEIFMKMMEGE